MQVRQHAIRREVEPAQRLVLPRHGPVLHDDVRHIVGQPNQPFLDGGQSLE